MAVQLDPSRLHLIDEVALGTQIEAITGWRPTGFCLHKTWGMHDEFLMYASVTEALREAGTNSRSEMFLYATTASLEEFEAIQGNYLRMTYHALARRKAEADAWLKSQPFFQNRIVLCELHSLGTNEADMYRWPMLFNDVAHAVILTLPEHPIASDFFNRHDPRELAYYALDRRERGDMRPPEMCQWCGVNPSDDECHQGHRYMRFCAECRELAHQLIRTADIGCPLCAMMAYRRQKDAVRLTFLRRSPDERESQETYVVVTPGSAMDYLVQEKGWQVDHSLPLDGADTLRLVGTQGLGKVELADGVYDLPTICAHMKHLGVPNADF